MTFATAQEAISALANVGSTQAEIIAFVEQLSVDASGSTTVLYSGDISGTAAWRIVEDMGGDVRHIGKTMMAEVLNSNEFTAKVAQTFGYQSIQDFLDAPNDSPAKRWLNKGGTGPWAVASEKFVEATTGNVRILTLSPAADSVLFNNEIPKLLDKLQNSNSITSIDGFSRADLLKVGASYSNSTNWTEAMRNALVSTAITQTHYSKPGLGSFSGWLDLTPDSFTNFYQNANAAQHKALQDLLSAFEVPRAATRALSRLGVIGALVGSALVAGQAGAAELAGDREGAKQIVTEWALDVAGSSAGQVVGAAVGATALAALATVGVVFSAPVAGALVLAAALLGGLFGAEAAQDVYSLTRNMDDNGKRDFFDRLTTLLFGEHHTLTSALPNDLDGGHLTLDIRLSDLTENAKGDIAWRHALQQLNAFAITDISYDEHNQNGELDLYDPDTGVGSLSESWIRARGEMVVWKNQFDQRNLPYTERLNHPGGLMPTPVMGDHLYRRATALI